MIASRDGPILNHQGCSGSGKLQIQRHRAGQGRHEARRYLDGLTQVLRGHRRQPQIPMPRDPHLQSERDAQRWLAGEEAGALDQLADRRDGQPTAGLR
jgi:hypothetical protein